MTTSQPDGTQQVKKCYRLGSDYLNGQVGQMKRFEVRNSTGQKGHWLLTRR
jgi:hypothetical protein